MANETRAVSWSDVDVVITPIGMTLSGISSISFSEERAVEDYFGAGNSPLDYTKGQVTFSDPEMTLGYNQWITLRDALGSTADRRAGKNRVNIVVRVRTEDEAGNITVKTSTLKGCSVLSAPSEFAQGSAPAEVTVTWKCLDIEYS